MKGIIKQARRHRQARVEAFTEAWQANPDIKRMADAGEQSDRVRALAIEAARPYVEAFERLTAEHPHGVKPDSQAASDLHDLKLAAEDAYREAFEAEGVTLTQAAPTRQGDAWDVLLSDDADELTKCMIAEANGEEYPPPVEAKPQPAGDEGGRGKVDDEQQDPALNKVELATLAALATMDARRLATVPDVCKAMPNIKRYSERAIGPAIQQLIDLDLAERPDGAKQGARLTIKGRHLASRLAD